MDADRSGGEGDFAFESGSFTVTVQDGTAVAEGRYLVVARRVDGDWRIVAHMTASSMPAPPADMDGG